jgi:ApbE superfamily uncharacterized protein (UPF0280 family)
MPGSAVRRQLNDGRWHFQHGPIDLVIACEGGGAACETALAQAWAQFQCVLADLSPQLPALRSPVVGPLPVDGRIATAMVRCVQALRRTTRIFITPMAAVAGSVADEIADCFRGPDVERAYCQQRRRHRALPGAGAALRCRRGHEPGMAADRRTLPIEATSPVRGIATSGWRGAKLFPGASPTRSRCWRGPLRPPMPAATMIANQVDVDSPAVVVGPPAC